MAGRKLKVGLDYWPFDVNFFSDIKIRKLIKYQSGKAITVYAYLLCSIYEKGYYMRWDNELPFVISEITGYEEAYIQEVIKCCVNIGLFSKELFDRDGVLTSKGLQERFQFISKSCNRKAIVSEFSAISSEEMNISFKEIPINSELSPQSKVKKSKVKETKVNIERSDFLIPQMVDAFLSKRPEYPQEETADFTALSKIIDFIKSQEKIAENPYESQPAGEQIKFVWALICDFVAADKFYKTFSLKSIASNIQTISLKIQKNGGKQTISQDSANSILDSLV